MKLSKTLVFISQSITIGLFAGLLIVFLKPELIYSKRPVVEVHEEVTPVRETESLPRDTQPYSYADAVELAAPSVVNIYSQKIVSRRFSLLEDPVFKHFFNQAQPKTHQLETSLGSGVLFSPQGYVVTSNHVIAGADEIEILLHDGRSVGARIVGNDPDTDLAVLKIQLESVPSITLGDSDALRVGDVVLAIGNPFGVGQTVTMGIVGATGRKRLGLNTFENFIQTDAAINPGNSGGALINPKGHLIGINTAIFSKSGGSQGIGFAIPVSLVKQVMTEIIEHGHVIRGWIGVSITNINPAVAKYHGLQSLQGVVIEGVYQQSPALNAGLQPGDVLLSINQIELSDSRSLLDIVAQQKPGTVITIEGTRERQPHSWQVTVEERPYNP